MPMITVDLWKGRGKEKKKELIAISFLNNMDALAKYKPKDFVLSDLKSDFKAFFQNIGWLSFKKD